MRPGSTTDWTPPSPSSRSTTFAVATNPYRYPDVDFYSSEYLKPRATYTNVLAEFSGGSENTQYYVNLGYNNSGSLVRLNPDANAGE